MAEHYTRSNKTHAYFKDSTGIAGLQYASRIQNLVQVIFEDFIHSFVIFIIIAMRRIIVLQFIEKHKTACR